jgi:hypothetical protein
MDIEAVRNTLEQASLASLAIGLLTQRMPNSRSSESAPPPRPAR